MIFSLIIKSNYTLHFIIIQIKSQNKLFYRLYIRFLTTSLLFSTTTDDLFIFKYYYCYIITYYSYWHTD